MSAWLQAHPFMLAGAMFWIGALVGLLIVAILVSGRDPGEVRRDERKAGHW